VVVFSSMDLPRAERGDGFFYSLENYFAESDVGSGGARAALKTADLLDLVTHHGQVEWL
jgi:hypothetical protein